MDRPAPRIGIALSFLCLLILGVMPIIANSRPQGSSALGFAWILSLWQLIFALPLFVRELTSSHKGLFDAHFPRRVLARMFIVNLSTGLMFGLATWFYVLAMEQAGAVSAAIAIQAYPLFAMLVEMILLRRMKGRWELACTGILLVTLYYLGTAGSWRIDGFSLWFLVALCVPLLWGIAHVLIREELTNTPITPAQVTFFRVLLSALFLGVLYGLSGAEDWAVLWQRDLMMFGMVMGLFYYLELIVWFHAVRHIDVSLACSVTTPWPAVTMVLAVIFLDETVSYSQLVAFIVVALCVYLLLTAAGKRLAAARARLS